MRPGALLLLPALCSGALPAWSQAPRVETFSIADGLPSDQILDLAQDSAGRLWIATRSGMAVYDGHDFSTLTAADGLPVRFYQALTSDAEGRIWAATAPELHVYHQATPTWTKLPDSPWADHAPTSLAVLDRGGVTTLAVGTMGAGLLVFATGVWSRLDVADGLPASHVTSLSADAGTLHVGTAAGLCDLAGGELDCRSRATDPRLGERILALYSSASVPGRPPRLWILGPTWAGYLDGDRLVVEADGFRLHGLVPAMPGAIAVDRAGGVYFGSLRESFFLDPTSRRRQRLGAGDGLASKGLTTVFHDREANVWIGSLEGLSKIESRRFLSLDRFHGLLESEVTAVLEPTPGRFLLGHNAGLTYFDDDGIRTDQFDRPDSAPLNAYRVLDLAVDGRGHIWVAADNRGLHEQRRDGTWRRHAVAERVLAVEADPSGRLWALAPDELFVGDGEAFHPVDLGLGESSPMRWLTCGPDGRVYLATHHGLVWQDGDAWRRATGPDRAANSLYNVLAEPSGAVWVATRAGLYELDGDKLVAVRRGELSITETVYFLLKDPRGRYWFGTDDGVRIWDGERLRHLTYRHGLAGRETNRGAGLVDRAGRVWIGTERGVSIYQELYDAGPATAPGVEIRGVEVDGEQRSPGRELALRHHQRNLTFHVGTIALSREAAVRCRYRLDGFDRGWHGPLPVPATGIRYTNLPPGRYQFRIAVGWADGAWSDEVVTAAIVIERPLWREPWLIILAVLTLAAAVGAVLRFWMRTIQARNTKLEDLNLKLSAALAERQSLISGLESKSAELERFAYNVSHDLKSPLMTMSGFLGLLERDLAAGDADRLHGDMAKIKDAAGEMGRMIDEILQISRAGRAIQSRDDVCLTEVVADAVKAVGARLAERGVAIDIAADLPVVSGDRTRLTEVFQNLLENAVKYTGDEPRPRIEVGVRREGAETTVYVADNGMGIEPRYHEKVFGLFERLDTAGDGTGVGLALVRRIVEVHGGRVWVESEGEGLGSTFCFTLPGARPDDGTNLSYRGSVHGGDLPESVGRGGSIE